MLKLEFHIAVLWRNRHQTESHYDLLSPLEYREIQLQAKAGVVVILEAWTVGSGQMHFKLKP